MRSWRSLASTRGSRSPSQNGVDNRQAGQAGDIADDVMQLQVHLIQGLLHVIHMRGTPSVPGSPGGAAENAQRRPPAPDDKRRAANRLNAGTAATGNRKHRYAGRARSSHVGHSPGTPRSRAPPESGTEESSTPRLIPSRPFQSRICFSQSASAYRSCVNVGNERTFSASRSAGTATIDLRRADIDSRSIGPHHRQNRTVRLSRSSAFWPSLSSPAEDDGPGRENGHSPKRDRRRPIQPVPERHHCIDRTRPGTRLATGLDSSIARPVLTAAVNDSTPSYCARSLPAMTSVGGPRAS